MRMLSLPLIACLALALSAAQAAPPAPAAPTKAPSAAERIAAVPLIPREALFGDPDRGAVQLSPDGAWLSWVRALDGVANVWVAPAQHPDQARPVTRDTGRGVFDYRWTYQPGVLLYLRDTGGDEDYHLHAVDIANGGTRDLTPFARTQAQLVALSPKHPGEALVALNDRDPKWHDLYRVDLAGGRRTLVRRNDAQVAAWFADGDFRLVYATQARDDGGFNILRATADGWPPAGVIPFEDALTTTPLGVSADGRTLYLTDSRGRDTAALAAVDVASGERTVLLEDPRVDLADTLADPLTERVQAVAANYLRREWKPVDPAIAPVLARLRTLGDGAVRVNSRTLDDQTWLVAYDASGAPYTYYRYDRAGDRLTRLFTSRPALEDAPLVPSWPVEIRARDGLTLVSYLTLPRSADGNGDGKPDATVPLVLVVHGGPWERDEDGYDPFAQWLANRGYATLAVNYRGSTGFGKRFTNAGNGEWAGKMHDDLLDAVQWAIAQGVTTPDQVAIFGGSYGGYATLVGLTFTPDTFACGVDLVGPSNLNTLLASVPAYWASFYEQLARRMGDPRTEAGRRWLTERSPLTRADRIVRPLLIGQGANDPRVKQAESDQIVQAMGARGIPVTYVLFPDEGHGFDRFENSKAFTAVSEGFLQACLGGRAEPVGDDFAGSSITVPVGAAQVPGLVEALRGHLAEMRK